MGNAVAAMAAYQGGGKVKGPGTGTSDSVPVRLSKGEFVIPADSVKKIGAHTLHAMVAATHKHVTPKGNARVRRMANGGVVGEDPLRTYPDQQTATDALASMSAAARASAQTPAAPVAPSVVTPAAAPVSSSGDLARAGAQQAVADSYARGDTSGAVGHMIRGGYGAAAGYAADAVGAAGRLVSPIWNVARTVATGESGATAPPAAVPQPSAVATLASPSTAGAGRGTMNPPLAGQAGDARPDLANVPSLGGSTGTAVDGAAGVRKFVQNGKTLYSNVAGGDNDKLMSGNPGMQTVPAIPTGGQSGSAVADLARSYDQPGAMSNGSGAIILNARPFGFRTADQEPAAAPSGAMTRSQTQLAITAANNATSRANAQTGAVAQLGSSQIGAGASMYGADTGARTAVQRLAQEAPEVQARTAELGAQAKLRAGTVAAQQALLAAKTPEERQTAEENLRATLGKDHVVRGIAVNLPAQENGLPGGGAVWDDRTQTFRYPERQETAAPSAPPANHIAALKANPKLAAQFDQQYGAGAAKKYLGAQ